MCTFRKKVEISYEILTFIFPNAKISSEISTFQECKDITRNPDLFAESRDFLRNLDFLPKVEISVEKGS